MKIMYFDTETTGVNFSKNELVQVGGIIEDNHKILAEFNIYSRPKNIESIDPKALEINGFSIQQMLAFPPAEESFKNFYEIIKKYIDINNRHDRFIPAGQKIGFDIIFIKRWISQNCDNIHPITIFNHNEIDLITLVQMAKYYGFYKGSSRLIDVCGWLGVELLKAHDALADAKATRECIHKIMTIFKGDKI